MRKRPVSEAADAEAGARGGYGNPGAHTLGGFDQMAAVLGGFWDSLLGEGRRFWIVAVSDSHVHFDEPTRAGSDFWPGEFQKTYVRATRSYDDVLEGLRRGRIFAVAGDLITSLDVEVSSAGRRASVGDTLTVPAGAPVAVTIRFRDPDTLNHGGQNPKVARVDLIAGDVTGVLSDRQAFRNPTTRVVARVPPERWMRRCADYEIEVPLPPVTRDMYVRVRGTNTADLEPQMDVPGENPWNDLWFYSNPIFITVGAASTPDRR